MIDNSNNFPVRVTIPGYQVIASGIVHLSSTEVKFELANLVIKYKFISDSSGVRFDAAVINNELIINLYNFNNGLGEGKLEPTEIGTLGDKKLFATWYVNTLQSNIRQFGYTFMLMVG
ncbi:hypothetical protein LEO80_05770 [Aeromonas caviae]|jgi:hypothetical protein|uniref:DUF6864 domain-containing function n=1 Tax=Aeromonas caviae TaxID=648 RepID=UPI001D0A6606|nr:hypothetical protein [Aeromonas caviae]UDN28065.1 hypothetical protein LEO80_05770 [Aeromonas caviae]